MLAEKRVEQKFFKHDKEKDEQNLMGLSLYRTQLAEVFIDDSHFKVFGKGWHTDTRRQELPDWHLDKLESINKNTFLCSAIENTNLPNYISEKLFDALACLTVPVCYFSDFSKLAPLVDINGLINLQGLGIQSAVKKINDIQIQDIDLDIYRSNQNRLMKLFTHFDNLPQERAKVAIKTFYEFCSIVDS